LPTDTPPPLDVAPGSRPETACGEHGPALSAGGVKAAPEVTAPKYAERACRLSRKCCITYPTLLV
jgi:hypothetical protein